VRGWVDALLGALSSAAVGIIAVIARRLLYGRAEDEQMATKAAHQAVEAVDDALGALRQERTEYRAQIEGLERSDREKGRRIGELEGEVRDLKRSERELKARIAQLTAESA
jgi:chromosome segregation ATPase